MRRDETILYKYSLSDKTCTKKMIPNLRCQLYSAALTNDERYILCFINHDYFKVIDLLTMRIFQSKIEAPEQLISVLCVTKQCIINNETKQDLSTSGYVRQCWNSKEFKSIRYPPVHLLKIIEKYIYFDMVLYCMGGLGGTTFWRINVNRILNGCQDLQ